MGKPITEIKKELEECALQELQSRMQQYEQDERKGVQNLLARCVRRLEEEEKEQQRLEKMLEYERKYDFCSYICGIDEAGRGPLAGPVVAGAVVLPHDCKKYIIHSAFYYFIIHE